MPWIHAFHGAHERGEVASNRLSRRQSHRQPSHQTLQSPVTGQPFQTMQILKVSVNAMKPSVLQKSAQTEFTAGAIAQRSPSCAAGLEFSHNIIFVEIGFDECIHFGIGGHRDIL